MAFDQYHNIGFYIIVHNTPVKQETYEETRCTNTECKNHHKELKENVKFCPECGSKVDWHDVVEIEPYEYLDTVFGEDDGYLHDWFCNVKYPEIILHKNYQPIQLNKGEQLLICNRPFKCEIEEEFRNHPATKALIELVGECDIHYGFVEYQA